VRHLIDRCIRVAKANNGPSVIILPKDIQDEDYRHRAARH
jgi:pyruvate dehydrogenase (quinone)